MRSHWIAQALTSLGIAVCFLFSGATPAEAPLTPWRIWPRDLPSIDLNATQLKAAMQNPGLDVDPQLPDLHGVWLDINADGQLDLLLVAPMLCGNGGCELFVYDGANLRAAGSVFGSEITMNGRDDNDWPVLEAWSSHGVEGEHRVVYVMTGGRYEDVSPKPMVAEEALNDTQAARPACAPRTVSYADPGLVSISDRLIVTRLGTNTAVTGDAASQALASPNGTFRLEYLSPADFSRNGPWNTVVGIIPNFPAASGWQIEIVDHASGGVHFNWLNEDLLFIQPWWGRIVSTDLIFQISSGQFLYAQEADYGALIQGGCEG